MRDIAGRWKGTDGDRLLALRLDVGEGSLGMVSGDLHDAAGAHVCSFHSELVTQRWRDARALELRAPLTFQSRRELYGELTVLIYVPLPGRPGMPAQAELTWASHRRPGEATALRMPIVHEGRAFRTARLKVDRAIDATTGAAYDVPRAHTATGFGEVTIAGAFADAGIEMSVTDGDAAVVLPDGAARRGLSDDELHAILAGAAKGEPEIGWWLHMLIAPRYVVPGVLGIMYDSDSANPRHGVVVFFDELRRDAEAYGAALSREFIFTAVHELGHAFNLLHSFQKGYYGQDVPARPAALSWMNYPHYWPHGRMVAYDQADRFWNQFQYRFDREELVHLRHHEHGEVVMGGDAFGADGDRVAFVGSNGILAARLETHATYDFGEPVAMTLVLSNRTREPVALELVADGLDVVELTIHAPRGRCAAFEPLFSRRSDGRREMLAPGATRRLAISPFYGRHGFAFADPGTYRVGGVVRLPGQPPIALATTALCVLPPPRGLEKVIGDGIFGAEQGHFLSFYGGDHLSQGKQALEALVEDPRLLRSRTVARVRSVLAASYARRFQGFALRQDGATARVAPFVRPARLAKAVSLLASEGPAPAGGPGYAFRALIDALRMHDVPDWVVARTESEAEGGEDMIIARNRSIVEGVVEEVVGRRIVVAVSATRAAWPKVQDLAASYVGQTLAVESPEGEVPAPGDRVEIEGSLEPAAGEQVAFVAARIERR